MNAAIVLVFGVLEDVLLLVLEATLENSEKSMVAALPIASPPFGVHPAHLHKCTKKLKTCDLPNRLQ